MLDEFSYNSQLKADKAIKDGAFKDEIGPVVIKGKKGDTVFDTDAVSYTHLLDEQTVLATAAVAAVNREE